MKRILTILLISIIALSLPAKQQTADLIALEWQDDTTAVVNFIPGKNMFYLAYKDNKGNAKIIQEFISQHLEQIQNGNIYIKVNGYCTSFTNQKDNLSAAKERSNRVKSYLILHQKVKEQHFITHNSTKKYNGKGDIVNVSYMIKNKQAVKDTTTTKQNNNLTHNREIVTQASVAQESNQEEKTEPEPTLQTDSMVTTPVTPVKSKSRFIIALKTNLLFDIVLAPNIEMELPLGKKWSINGEYTFPWWLSNDNSKAMQLLSGGLEGRFWLGNREKHDILCGHFFGLYAGGGIYDFRNNGKGYQGDFYLAGISYGYGLKLNRSLNMEFSLGISYMSTNYSHYKCREENTIRAWQNDGKYTWIGPTKAKISLVWVIGREKKGGNL